MSFEQSECIIAQAQYATLLACFCGSLAQCALSLKRLSAGPGFNPQTRQNKLFQDYFYCSVQTHRTE